MVLASLPCVDLIAGHMIPHGWLPPVHVFFFCIVTLLFLCTRLAVGCKRRNLFTRGQQAEAFSAAYKTLPVHTTTLRNLGNYKGVFIPGVVVKRLGGMTKARAFQLLKDGPTQVCYRKAVCSCAHFRWRNSVRAQPLENIVAVAKTSDR